MCIWHVSNGSLFIIHAIMGANIPSTWILWQEEIHFDSLGISYLRSLLTRLCNDCISLHRFSSDATSNTSGQNLCRTENECPLRKFLISCSFILQHWKNLPDALTNEALEFISLILPMLHFIYKRSKILETCYCKN